MKRNRYAVNSKKPGEVSPSEAADLLGCHPRTVRRWVHEGGKGAIQTIRRDLFGRMWLDESEVNAFVSGASLSEI